MLVDKEKLKRFGERAFYEDQYLAYRLIPSSADNPEYVSPAEFTGKLRHLFAELPNTQTSTGKDAISIQAGLERIERYLQESKQAPGSRKSQKRFTSKDYLAQTGEKLDRVHQTFFELYQEIKQGYDGQDEQELVITNECIRYFLMVCAVCPPLWIPLRPGQLTREDWNTNTYAPDYIKDFLKPALRLHDNEVDLVNAARNRMIRELELQELKTEVADEKNQGDSAPNADASLKIPSDQPLASTFIQTWKEFKNESRFEQQKKDRLRNLKSNANTYKQALDAVVAKNPKGQVISPVFGIQGNRISDRERRELLSAAWGEFTAFIQNPGRKTAGLKVQSSLLSDYLIWWVIKQHVALLPAAGKRWQPHSYLVTMMLYKANTFEPFPDPKLHPVFPAQKSWSPTMSALEEELKRLWDFSVMKAANKKLDVKGTPTGYVEFHSKIPEVPPGVNTDDRSLDITCLSPQNKDTFSAYLHHFLEYHIFRDRALFVTLLPKPGQRKKPQTLRKMGKARNLPLAERPWFIPPEQMPSWLLHGK